MLAIPGTGSTEHLVENIAAGTVRFSKEELEVLDAIGERAD